MTLHIPDRAKDAFKDNMKTGGSVELPFAAPAFYWVNGDAKLAALQNFQFFGGWAVNADKLKIAAESWEDTPFPVPNLQEAVAALEDGKTMPVYAARSVLIAPIGMREFSTIEVNGQTKRVAPFTPSGRPGIQMVAVLAYKDSSGVIFHWAPIMLTAKGYQVNHLKKAIKNWQKAIEPTVKKLAPDSDPAAISNLFYLSLGTFGRERIAETVGSGQNKKPITPISCYIPETVTEEMLTKLYVGDAMAEWMADLATQAKEWFAVFQNMEQPAKKNGNMGGAPEEPPFNPDDDIPF